MIIYNLKINHIDRPLGFMIQNNPVVSYKIKEAQGKYQKSVRIIVAADEMFSAVLYDSGEILQSAAVYPLPFQLEPKSRYHTRVQVISDIDEVAEAQTWFETGKMQEPWSAEWIATTEEDANCPVLGMNFTVDKPVARARAYVSCAGLYKVELNGEKVGSEYLTPYCNDYSSWMQIITHDVTAQIHSGNNNLETTLAPGWYSGRIGLPPRENNYGDSIGLILELYLWFEDGTQEVIVSNRDWYARDSFCESASIYDGAVLDYRRDTTVHSTVKKIEVDKSLLRDRLSLPVVVKHEINLKEIIETPKGELCMDFGQNIAGFLRIDNALFPDTDFTLKYFESLDPDGNYYGDNLRTAKQEFVYQADGQARIIEPEFTYYGFRYVMVEGLDQINQGSFTACSIYSDIEDVGSIQTSSSLVNQLFRNVLWSQRDNFVDVPTDCPQRDERLGWTGDAQVFCGTAHYNTDATAFFAKYMYDIRMEQKKADGLVPVFVPAFGNNTFSSSAWGDAATIIPWVTYLHNGDSMLLEAQYPAMKAWVEYIRKQETEAHLWRAGFHFGDWLALDNANPDLPMGSTPADLIASAYYLYSTSLLFNAAKVLDKIDDYVEYLALADQIRVSLQKEYVTETGRIASDSQTANVVALFMGFARDTERAAAMLNDKVMGNNGGHLSTGFVGTAYLCRALSDFGYNDTAYKLLLNRDYPSWLYAVERGATTIWERWNSIMPDGSMGKVEMNSFNHYAYGAVMEWMYRNAGGLQPLENGAGFRTVQLSPQPSSSMEWYTMRYDSACGLYRSEWRIEKEKLQFLFEIPFDAQAQLTLPHVPEMIWMNGQQIRYEREMALESGIYEICYVPTHTYYKVFGLDSDYKQVLSNPRLMAVLSEDIPAISHIPPEAAVMPFEGNIQAFLMNFGISIDERTQVALNEKLAAVRTWDV